MTTRRRLKLADRPNGLAEDELIDRGAYELPAATQHAAALVICDQATDAGDARLLLEACGLAAYEHGQFVSYSYGRRS
jgi:hypothetical protein